MDIIVGCNGVDLTELTFNECMSVIRHADWPKTLHFIRDPSTANAVPVIKEGWTKFGVAGAGNAHRRRYLEVKEGDIFYFKPTPGGAISKDPDGNVQLVMVETFSKIMDRTTTEDEQFQIKLLFKDASKLPVVIACASAEDMDEWADALCKAQPDGFGDAAAKGVTTLESEDLEKGAVAVDDLLLFDDLGGTFKQQRFVLTEGGDNGPELRLGPRVLGLGMPGGQSTVLSLKQIVAPKCASVEPIGAGHQLLIDTLESTLIVGLPDQQTALKWVDALVKAISRCKPQPEMVVGPGAVVIEDWDPASKNAAQQESAAADNRVSTRPPAYGFVSRRTEPFFFVALQRGVEPLLLPPTLLLAVGLPFFVPRRCHRRFRPLLFLVAVVIYHSLPLFACLYLARRGTPGRDRVRSLRIHAQARRRQERSRIDQVPRAIFRAQGLGIAVLQDWRASPR